MHGKALRFEHYEVTRDEKGECIKLGLGGMGTTFRAYDLHLRKLVALKIINENTLADPTARRRFYHEAIAAASIDHPNVAKVLHLCREDAPEYFFVMELVEGQTLARRISLGGPLPPGEALTLLRPIADALIVLGSKGLVHRDIKPENIMITSGLDGHSDVKLIDFGLAKTLSPESSQFEAVQTGERFVGSVYFASPEQIRPTGGMDCRSDFYSLGVTLWYAVTGAPPFIGTVYYIQNAHVYQEPPWEKIAELPQPLTVLLRSLLAKSPAQRPLNATVLVAQWDAAIAAFESLPTRMDAAGQAKDPVAPAQPPSTAEPSPAPADAPEKGSGEDSRAVESWLLDEAALPPPYGRISRDPGARTWRLRRTIPAGLNPEVRAALEHAARTAQRQPHPGLLTVHEVTEAAIVSAWPTALAAAQFPERFGGAVPLDLILAWLPRLAETLDGACARGLSHVGMQPDRVLVEFDPKAGLPKGADDLERWKNARLWLDPLGNFDTALQAAARSLSGASRNVPVFLTVRDYIVALARLLRDLMGGKPTPGSRPIPSLDERRNRMLAKALIYEVYDPSVAEWAAAFLTGGQEPPSSVPVAAAAAAHPVEQKPPAPRTAPQAPAVSASPNLPPPVAASPPADHSGWRSSRVRRGAAVFSSIALVAGLCAAWIFWSVEKSESEAFRNVYTAAETAVEQQNLDAAQRNLISAENIDRTNQRLPALRDKIAALRARLASREVSNGPGPGLPTVPPPPPGGDDPVQKTVHVPDHDPPKDLIVLPATPDSATKEAPYVNSFGMKFVPLPAKQTNLRVLISVYETRVQDFIRYVDPQAWSPQPFQTPEHPAVGIAPVDALDFAKRLTARDHLPAGWRYDLPTETEWDLAVGRDAFPWGNEWPPPSGAANIGDASLSQKTKLAGVAGYNDGFPYTAPVGSFRANSLGIYDLSGNAAEWCYHYAEPGFILRGGSWTTSNRAELRSSEGRLGHVDERHNNNGFRLVLLKGKRENFLPQSAPPARNGGYGNMPSLFNPGGR